MLFILFYSYTILLKNFRGYLQNLHINLLLYVSLAKFKILKINKLHIY